ncbi:MAG: putative transcriptional regulator, TetR family protein [Marmoricola sp.]|nr:putative transcriptional regulator, TetR family protein [Marmoricola sp.]
MTGPSVEATPQVRASQSAVLTPILAAALDAFDEHSFHGATVRDIARRVGMTVPALYYHHENKEAMLYALLDASITRLAELCGEVDTPGASPRHRYTALVECLVRYTAVSRKLSRLDAEIRSLTPAHRATYSEKRASIELRLLSALTDGAAADQFDVTFPRETVRALVGMIQAITTWFDVDGELSLDTFVHRYLDIAGRMAGAR